MTIQWGGESGHMSVGIEVTTDGYDTNTTSVNVYVDFYIKCGPSWNFGDAQTLTAGGNVGGSWNFQNNLSSNQTQYIGRAIVYGQGLSYGGGPTYYFSGQISGHYQGATPSCGVYFTLPARPPNYPTPPGVGVDSVTASSARAVVYAPDPRGSGIDAYETALSLPGPNWSGWTTSFGGGTGTATGLAPATTYQFASRAHNGVGWSAWGYSGNFTTGATVPGTPTAVGSNTVGQTTANVTWTAPSNGGSAILDYTLQIATDAGFSQNVQTLTFSGSPAALTTLVPGTLYYYRVRANNAVGNGAYSAAQQFTTLAGTPTILIPTEGSVRTDAIVNITLSALGIAADRTITLQVSKDNTFTTGVKTVTLNPSGPSGNNQYILTDPAQYLDNGIWYARAKVTNNTSGYVTPWSTVVSYTEAHTPSATLLAPAGGAVAQYAASVLFSWRFTDPGHPNDLQSAYRLVLENNNTGASIYDSGKTALVSTASDTTVTVPVAIAAALKNQPIRWRVMVWDKGDQASAWTAYSLATFSDPPAVTIITPPAALAVGTGAPTFSWSASIPSGGSQASAVVTVFDAATNEQVWQGVVTGGATTITPPVVILRNNKSYYTIVSITDTVGLSGTATRNFTTDYPEPAVVSYTIDAVNVDESGYVRIDWVATDPDPLFAEWKVYRRVNEGEWEVLATITDQNTRTYDDYMIVAGESYSYSMTQVAMRSGVLLESSVGYYLSGTDVITETRTYNLALNHYWLINPDDPSQSVRLLRVTADDTTLEGEQETTHIIGRGRHVDYGDELGYTGTLTVQCREPERRSTFRDRMEALWRSQETYYLRTPFGRLFPVSIGNLSWTPMAGVGPYEKGDMGIPYQEVH